ncbi:MAG: hypothetical protein K2X27_02280 [Candidatus Obscuribacterales bacterium]|nr:hypothetical protein [Candidatus Obscuribacterales bacterium]
MSESSNKDADNTRAKKDWDTYIQKFLATVPPLDSNTFSSGEQALKYLKELAQRLPESLSFTIKTMIELLQEFTNIKGVDLQFKSLRILDLKMHILKETDLPLNRDIIGIGKIEALRLSKLIHFQAEVGDGNKDLRMHIHEGLSVVLSVVFLGSKQIIPLKGTAKLLKDEKGQLLVESTAYLPGTDLPVTVSFPLKQILDEVRKQMF